MERTSMQTEQFVLTETEIEKIVANYLKDRFGVKSDKPVLISPNSDEETKTFTFTIKSGVVSIQP